MSEIDICTEITRSKGFKPEDTLALQITLIMTECAEALKELIVDIEDAETHNLILDIAELLDKFEEMRKEKETKDYSEIIVNRKNNFLEELADIQIRVNSLVGSLGLGEEYEQIKAEKIQRNKERPKLHGKKY